jgi:Nuclease-related domain
MEIHPDDPIASKPDFKRLRLRYPGVCILCGTQLAKGAEALYDKGTRTVRCMVCPTEVRVQLKPIDTGTAGGSAAAKYDRLHAAREGRIKGRLGNFLGGIVLAVTDAPQSTQAWKRGAIGEQKLAEALGDVEGLRLLHDRRVPNTRGNIDHLVVGPAGIFVVDAKLYKGLIRIRDRGGFLRADLRLYVGSHDCSELADNMGWQLAAVQSVLESAGVDPMPPVTAVLCFVDGEWPLISPPQSFRGVRLEGKRSIKSLVTKTEVLTAGDIEKLTRLLATAFPPK